MNKKISAPIALIIVLILAVIVGGFTYLETKKSIMQFPEIKITDKKCSRDNSNLCDKSCNSDGDCKFDCACGPINKEETCNYNDLYLSCVLKGIIKCENNNCVIKEKNETADWKIYTNEEYGFTLTLSQGWQGYSVATSSVEYGWKVVIRNPQWTEANPYEDIPILVYPIEQWRKWEANNFEDYPTAAPIGPLERGRNARYVFATAPRYNYDYRTGWEDVENIIKTLKPF